MVGSWSPCRTEAKARKALPGTQQSAEPEEMGDMRGEGPKKGCTELPGTAETQILHWQEAQMLLVAAFSSRDLSMRRATGLSRSLQIHCKRNNHISQT